MLRCYNVDVVALLLPVLQGLAANADVQMVSEFDMGDLFSGGAPAAPGPGPGGKGNGSGKGKRRRVSEGPPKKVPKAVPATPALPSTPSPSTPSLAPAPAVSRGKPPVAKAAEQAQVHTQKIEVLKILSGESTRSEIYQARRCKETLEKNGFTTEAQKIEESLQFANAANALVQANNATPWSQLVVSCLRFEISGRGLVQV